MRTNNTVTPCYNAGVLCVSSTSNAQTLSVSTPPLECEESERPMVEPTECRMPEPTECPTSEPTELECPTPDPTECPMPDPTESPTPDPTEHPEGEPCKCTASTYSTTNTTTADTTEHAQNADTPLSQRRIDSCTAIGGGLGALAAVLALTLVGVVLGWVWHCHRNKGYQERYDNYYIC